MHGIPVENSPYNIYDPLRIKHLNRLCINEYLSHLSEHRFGHDFDNPVNSLSSYSFATESTTHIFPHDQGNFYNHKTLMNQLNSIRCGNLPQRSDDLL